MLLKRSHTRGALCGRAEPVCKIGKGSVAVLQFPVLHWVRQGRKTEAPVSHAYTMNCILVTWEEIAFDSLAGNAFSL